jgi:hypothetical protein
MAGGWVGGWVGGWAGCSKIACWWARTSVAAWAGIEAQERRHVLAVAVSKGFKTSGTVDFSGQRMLC